MFFRINRQQFLTSLRDLYESLRLEKREQHNRGVSFGDLFTDRWERAKFHGFGEGCSVYDNVLVLGEVEVGEQTWVGPNVVLDGSGGLKIGKFVSVSAGVQIYTHDTVAWSTSMGSEEIQRKPTTIGDGVYIGPNAIISKGVNIGDRAVIGAMAFVNSDIPAGAKAFGIPAKIVERGEV